MGSHYNDCKILISHILNNVKDKYLNVFVRGHNRPAIDQVLDARGGQRYEQRDVYTFANRKTAFHGVKLCKIDVRRYICKLYYFKQSNIIYNETSRCACVD